MFTVCFVSHHFRTPEILLKTILKMTPGSCGVWKDMKAVTDPNKADFIAVLDGHAHVTIPKERALYFGQHPFGHTAYRSLDDVGGLVACPQKTHLNPGEWWITYDYDFLTALDNPEKTKDLISITTYHTDQLTYRERILYLEAYVKNSKNIDIYGRQERNYNSNPVFRHTYRGRTGNPEGCNGLLGEHIIGKDIEISYRYALDFDHGKTETGEPVSHYFSERFYDSMLLWTMPIYFGSDNVERYLPKNSFVYTNIHCSGAELENEVRCACEIVNSDFREQHIDDIRIARDLLLNKYQLWAYVYDVITHIDEYKNGTRQKPE